MKTNVSLNELNLNGQLICSFKKVAFILCQERAPYLFHSGDPITIYLHFYHDEYYVTSHIITSQQIHYHDFESAQLKFAEFINCCENHNI